MQPSLHPLSPLFWSSSRPPFFCSLSLAVCLSCVSLFRRLLRVSSTWLGLACLDWPWLGTCKTMTWSHLCNVPWLVAPLDCRRRGDTNTNIVLQFIKTAKACQEMLFFSSQFFLQSTKSHTNKWRRHCNKKLLTGDNHFFLYSYTHRHHICIFFTLSSLILSHIVDNHCLSADYRVKGFGPLNNHTRECADTTETDVSTLRIL